jgi:tRNA pseudouridine38-40 synthase
MNIRLTIAYDGSRYAGWQTQDGRLRSTGAKTPKTIQGTLEKVLKKILREKVVLFGSGRTDAGVHALAMAAHFHTTKTIDLFRLKGSLNGLLPSDIAVLGADEVSQKFHAQFDRSRKTYQYLVIARRAKSVFSLPGVVVTYALNVRRMHEEARCLSGKHDFRSFQGADRRPRRSVTTLHQVSVQKIRPRGIPFLAGDTMILFEIRGSGFLRGMVRNIVGTLLDIGRGKIKKGELKAILDARDRRKAGLCAPARGLFLSDVVYE